MSKNGQVKWVDILAQAIYGSGSKNEVEFGNLLNREGRKWVTILSKEGWKHTFSDPDIVMMPEERPRQQEVKILFRYSPNWVIIDPIWIPGRDNICK